MISFDGSGYGRHERNGIAIGRRFRYVPLIKSLKPRKGNGRVNVDFLNDFIY